MTTKKNKLHPGLPVGHIYDIQVDAVIESKIRHLLSTLHPPVPVCTSLDAFLGDVVFSATAYRNDSVADKTRVRGIDKGLWAIKDKEGSLDHGWAAKQWLDKHGGKSKSIERARTALRKQKVQGRPAEYAKHMLACSLCAVLMKHTQGASISTSRDNHAALTQNGALARLFQGVLQVVDGRQLSDPFPYLKTAVDSLKNL